MRHDGRRARGGTRASPLSRSVAVIALLAASIAAYLHLLLTSEMGMPGTFDPRRIPKSREWEGSFNLDRIAESVAGEGGSSAAATAPGARGGVAGRTAPGGGGRGGLMLQGPPARRFNRSVVAEGLSGPDGIAVDERSGRIFVSEESADRIVALSGARRRTVWDGTRPIKASCEVHGGACPPLRSPEGLAYDGRGTLYAVEDVPGGRLLALRIDRSGAVRSVDEVEVPGEWSRYAWEAVAVREGGELLLAGSTAEHSGTGQGLPLFSGVLLHRDGDGHWWAPRALPGSSPSSVAFSKSGRFALFADEALGAVGWIDLEAPDGAEGASRVVARSPENVSVLPDGTLLVAEEDGWLLHIDPETDRCVTLVSGLGPIETAVWDPRGDRILVTADADGALLALAPDRGWPEAGDRMELAACGGAQGVQHVPRSVPAYLKPVLEMGGVTGSDAEVEDLFQRLARNLPMIAADADATLVTPDGEVDDPIEHIQFVAFDPNGINLDANDPDFPTSLFVLRSRSGKLIKTSLIDITVSSGNLWRGYWRRIGDIKITVPYAAGAHVGADGVAFVHFVGLGRTPDLSLVLNPRAPDESYMVLHHTDGRSDQYALRLPPSASIDHWVASIPARPAQPWMRLMGTPGAEVPL